MLQQRKAFVQAGSELINGKHGKKGSSQFQRERNTIQLTTDMHDGRCIMLCETKARVALSSAFTKELDGFVACKLFDRIILLRIRR